MSRPETPKMSVATMLSLIWASSSNSGQQPTPIFRQDRHPRPPRAWKIGDADREFALIDRPAARRAGMAMSDRQWLSETARNVIPQMARPQLVDGS
jgi:hypothetical protein